MSNAPESNSPGSPMPNEMDAERETTVVTAPPRPSFKGLSHLEANEIRRGWEKLMYRFLSTYGTLSNEPCGPCARTRTQCIRHPIMNKCTLCFRGHDVCEMWDDSVQNAGRRRVGTKKTQKREAKVSQLRYCLIARTLKKRRQRIRNYRPKSGLPTLRK